jgi:hypothetical protein
MNIIKKYVPPGSLLCGYRVWSIVYPVNGGIKSDPTLPVYYQTNDCYAFGGVPSAFDTTASIWTKASSGKADTPTVLRAGTPPGKKVL